MFYVSVKLFRMTRSLIMNSLSIITTCFVGTEVLLVVDSFADHELSINNYILFRRDRGTIGGGLVL